MEIRNTSHVLIKAGHTESQDLITLDGSIFIQAATADNTRAAYQSAIKQFIKHGGRLPSDKVTLINYLIKRSKELNPRSLDVHLSAISQWHIAQFLNDPTKDIDVQKIITGIRRVRGVPKRKAKALRPEHILTMVSHLRAKPATLKVVRDIAIVLNGFFGSFRRSELVNIQMDDLKWEPEGLIITLPRSKTDQAGEGKFRALPYGDNNICPATSLRTWLTLAGISEGPIFRAINKWGHIQNRPLSAGSINELLKKIGSDCGFDFIPELSSHSLRRGMATSSAREKIDFSLIKKQGGWLTDSVVWGYMEDGELLTENAAKILMEKMARMKST